MKNINNIIFSTIFLLITYAELSGQEPIKIKRITGHIEFDGIPKEAAWESVDLLPLVMHRPNSGASTSESSDVRIDYDDEFGTILDSYRDNENGLIDYLKIVVFALKFVMKVFGNRIPLQLENCKHQ